jgi:hypothetical protein
MHCNLPLAYQLINFNTLGMVPVKHWILLSLQSLRQLFFDQRPTLNQFEIIRNSSRGALQPPMVNYNSPVITREWQK